LRLCFSPLFPPRPSPARLIPFRNTTTTPPVPASTSGGGEIDEHPGCSSEEEDALRRYLDTCGWSLGEGNAVEPLSALFSVRFGSETSAALAESKPDVYRFETKDGIYSGWLHGLSVPGYVDKMTIWAFVYVENGSVTGAVLQGNLHQSLTWAEQGESSFQEFYPIDTPRETIQKDAAKYLSKYGKKPFDETAALDLPGGHRVSEKQQEEFSALFLWKKPNYDFLYVDHAMPYSALEYEEYDKIAEPVYAAVYATPGIPLTKGEVYSLFCNCYYSESVYRSGKKHYAVDFMLRLHAGYPDPENPATGTLEPARAWLT